jgi:hypothetical protein
MVLVSCSQSISPIGSAAPRRCRTHKHPGGRFGVTHLRFVGAYWQHGVNYTCRPWAPSDDSWLVLAHSRLADQALESATIIAGQHCVLVGDLMTTAVHPTWTVVVIRLPTITQFCSAAVLAPMGHLELPSSSTCWYTTNVVTNAHHIQAQIKFKPVQVRCW